MKRNHHHPLNSIFIRPLGLLSLIILGACSGTSSEAPAPDAPPAASGTESAQPAEGAATANPSADPAAPASTQAESDRPARAGEDGIARHDDGSIAYMSQDAAIQFCQSAGMHLPSAHEFAEFGQLHGAIVRDSRYRERELTTARLQRRFQRELTQMRRAHYDVEVTTLNGRGVPVPNFFMNLTGYQRPEGVLGSETFWTSSVRNGTNQTQNMGYYFNGVDGSINDLVLDDSGNIVDSSVSLLNRAVRCLPGASI